MHRILVVDDSSLVRRGISELLGGAGYEVVAVASGEEAVERVATEPFSLVVSDVRMGAMTGVQLCRVLRSDPPTREIPIVLLTGSDDPRSRFWGMHGGADAYLSKEGSFETLVPAVARLIAARPPGERSAARRSGRVDAASRVSAVMDQQLFEAVVAAEARKLMADVDDRQALAAATARLIRDVFSAPAVVLTLHTVEEPTHAIVVRGADAPTGAEEAISRLKLEASSVVACITDTYDRAVSSLIGGPEVFRIGTDEAPLGTLRVYRGTGQVGSDDRATARLLVEAIAPVARCATLIDETRRLARTDTLTGLANRRTLIERLELEDSRAARYGNPLTVFMVDVDHFKSVNDGFGHATGDSVLQNVAAALRASIRNVDLAGRWGGEEFVVILPECDRNHALTVAQRVLSRIKETCTIPGSDRVITASCGMATRDRGAPDALHLIDRADTALYRAKRDGRDRALAFD